MWQLIAKVLIGTDGRLKPCDLEVVPPADPSGTLPVQGILMGKKKSSKELGARERQIMDILFELGEGSVGDVRERMSDPPSYSSVRTMIRLLESKGFLKQSGRVGTKYVYKPTQSMSAASKSALQRVLRTFFGGSAPDAVAAILSSEKLSNEDLQQIEQLIEDARKEGR